MDPYHSAVPRLLAGLTAPRKGLIGPWSHYYPYEAAPGPAIEYLDDALRWWDHWLKGIDTGIMREPMLRVWMQHEAACCGMRETTGRWVAEAEWPTARIQPRRYYLTPDGIAPTRAAEVARPVPPIQSVGMAGGHWCPFDMDTELARDQRIDDARSLGFDAPPLTERLEILGAPVVRLEVTADRPVAMVAVRLNDVAPDGCSRRVTLGVLNLTHRNGHESPEALVPGQRYQVRVQLKDIAHSFQPGHRIRVAISSSYWPMVLPTPEVVQLTVLAGVSELILPVRRGRVEDNQLADFGAPAQQRIRLLERVEGGGGAPRKHFEVDIVHDRVTLRSIQPASRVRFKDIGTIRENGDELVMEISDSNPEGATLHDRRWTSWERGDWNPRVETELRLTLTATEYQLKSTILATNGAETVFTRSWDHRISRRLG